MCICLCLWGKSSCCIPATQPCPGCAIKRCEVHSPSMSLPGLLPPRIPSNVSCPPGLAGTAEVGVEADPPSPSHTPCTRHWAPKPPLDPGASGVTTQTPPAGSPQNITHLLWDVLMSVVQHLWAPAAPSLCPPSLSFALVQWHGVLQPSNLAIWASRRPQAAAARCCSQLAA